jgi:hypothetical protein
MSIYRYQRLRLDHVKTYPLHSRPSKVSVSDFARVPPRNPSIKRWLSSLPNILAARSFRAVIDAMKAARTNRKPIIWGLGGHVIKCGLSPVLIDLMKRGYVTAVAMNGSTLIHDFEVALVGFTSEDVPEALAAGTFGMAEETGRLIHESIRKGDSEGLGMGESVGRFLARGPGQPKAQFRRYSLLAAAYREGVPVTVHQAIGTDIIHAHPSIDPKALGAASHRDFLLLASLVKQMDGGGVYLNVGSAVVLPEVFLKCFSLAANLNHSPRGITTVNMDFIQHYRPTENVVGRPVKAATKASSPSGQPSYGYSLTGHHELMIPLLAAALAQK